MVLLCLLRLGHLIADPSENFIKRHSLVTESKAITLSTQVQYLQGVGPARAKRLEKLGIHTAQQLLFFFPRD
jgi:predicted flap endonuclease-1-like 5' DNA nuclease